MLRRGIAIALVLLSAAPVVVAQPIQKVRWENLSTVIVGKKVSIVTPAGDNVTGMVRLVEADTLVLRDGKPANSPVCDKGTCRITRVSVNALQIHGKTHRFRIVGTTLGAIAGFFSGVLVGFAIEGGGIFGPSENEGLATVVAIAIIAGLTAGGYALGNLADRKTTTLVIEP